MTGEKAAAEENPAKAMVVSMKLLCECVYVRSATMQ